MNLKGLSKGVEVLIGDGHEVERGSMEWEGLVDMYELHLPDF